MKAKRTPKPEPVVQSTVCSLCGLPWEDHGDDPTVMDCIRLLRDRPMSITYPNWSGGYDIAQPYRVWCGTSARTIN